MSLTMLGNMYNPVELHAPNAENECEEMTAVPGIIRPEILQMP